MKFKKLGNNEELTQKLLLGFIAILLGFFLFFMKERLVVNTELSNLAERSLEPEVALANGRPTVFEFYADWCEVCQEMAPDILKLEAQTKNQIDLVLLNIDNNRWIDLIEEYEVMGVPQLDFFDSKGMHLGSLSGLHSFTDLRNISNSLISEQPIPSFSKDDEFGQVSLLPSEVAKIEDNGRNIRPMSHS